MRLVREALRERGLLCQNAPHLVKPLLTIVPLYAAWEGPYFGLGVKAYDWLSGRHSLGRSRWLSLAEAIQAIPTLEPRELRGGVAAEVRDDRAVLGLVGHLPGEHVVVERGRAVGGRTWEATLVGGRVHDHGGAQLLHVAEARNALGRLAGLA